tara:strand:+ start:201 stop:887 length:687 start_codon:yes stop_codon:yes gene_type:complete
MKKRAKKKGLEKDSVMTDFSNIAADRMDKVLFAALWSALDQQSLGAVSLERMADEAGLATTDVYVRYANSDAVLLAALHALDTAALRQSADDFADAPEASVHEKLVEGLISRFELYAPLRVQMQAVHRAAQHHPVLAACLLTRLADMTDRLLSLCGDHVTGWRRQVRINGIVAVLMQVRPVWQSDETTDLALTLSSLDKELRRAAEWAVSFRVLDAADLDDAAPPQTS